MKISELWIECGRCGRPMPFIPEKMVEEGLRMIGVLDDLRKLEPGKAILFSSHCMSCRKDGETSAAMFRFGVITERPGAGRVEGVNVV
jgi:hypothetical protein